MLGEIIWNQYVELIVVTVVMEKTIIVKDVKLLKDVHLESNVESATIGDGKGIRFRVIRKLLLTPVGCRQIVRTPKFIRFLRHRHQPCHCQQHHQDYHTFDWVQCFHVYPIITNSDRKNTANPTQTNTTNVEKDTTNVDFHIQMMK